MEGNYFAKCLLLDKLIYLSIMIPFYNMTIWT